MPYVNIKITKEGGPDGVGPTAAEKAELIKGTTELLARVLNKNPSTTFVVIDEVAMDSWGAGGLPVAKFREQISKG